MKSFNDPKRDEGKPSPDKTPPKLDAVLPDDFAPAAAELIGDIDSYQKRLEKEWETAKNSYRNKINHIMEEFLHENMESAQQAMPPGPESFGKSRQTDGGQARSSNIPETPAVGEPLAALLAKVEGELQKSGLRSKELARFDPRFAARQSLLGNFVGRRRNLLAALIGILALAGSLFAAYSALIPLGRLSSLPYLHAMGPVMKDGQLYIVDWFRRDIYAHALRKGAPIVSVEHMPNPMVTGFAFTEDALWTVNGLDATLLQHSLTNDHRVTATFPTPGGKPAGLFYDGTDFWIADESEKALFRLHGKDVEEVRERYDMPEMSVGGLMISGNRAWMIDGKSREAVEFRIQSPLRELNRYDLDAYLNGGTPSGLWVEGSTLYVAAREPANLLKIPLRKLKKSS